MNRLSLIRTICSFLPPIISQSVREKLISINEAEQAAYTFSRKSFTGSYLKGTTADFHAFKFYIHGYFDWRNIVLTRKILQLKKGNVVEVGANIGTETISLADVAKPFSVYAFEPVTSNYKSVLQAKVDNKLSNLFIYKEIVSDKQGKSQFKVPTQNNSGSGHVVLEKDSTTEEFEVVTLNNRLRNFSPISTIIADVEGHEYNIIKGASDIIKKDKPYLIIEVNSQFLKNRARISAAYLFDELQQMGYQIYYIGKLGLKEVIFELVDSKTNKNWICIPKEDVHNVNILSNTILFNAFNPFLNYKIF